MLCPFYHLSFFWVRFIIFRKVLTYFFPISDLHLYWSKFVETNQAETQCIVLYCKSYWPSMYVTQKKLYIFQTWWRHCFALFVLDRCHVGDGRHPDLDPGPTQRNHRPLRQARKLLEEQSSQELQTIQKGENCIYINLYKIRWNAGQINDSVKSLKLNLLKTLEVF